MPPASFYASRHVPMPTTKTTIANLSLQIWHFTADNILGYYCIIELYSIVCQNQTTFSDVSELVAVKIELKFKVCFRDAL